MAVEHLTATSRGDKAIAELVTTRDGLNVFESTVEVSAAASTSSTYKLAKLPTNIRILGLSRVMHDDLASTGSPTLDFGFQADGANITTSTTYLNDGVDVATAASNDVPLIKDPANTGKYVWEFAGESSDPGGEVWLYCTLVDAAANTGGTLSLSLAYWVDNS